MARRFALSVSVIFFFLVSAQAFVPMEDFIRSDSNWISTDSDPEAEPAGTILLPSEKPEGKIDWKTFVNSEQLQEAEVTVGKLPEVEIKEGAVTTTSKPGLDSEIDEEKIQELAEPVKMKEEPVSNVPLTVVTFRPMTRHFQRMHDRQTPFPYRMPHRCRHHYKPVGPRFIQRERRRQREIPYGNDMITEREREDEAAVNVGPVLRGGRVGHHPARWVKLHLKGPKIPMGHKVLSREDFKRPDTRMEREDMERGAGEGEKEEGGLFKGFRKFLNGF